MVSYARQRYNVDPARIVVSGFSSGAMMTNVLAAQYPDVFSAGAAFSGVPAGCFATTNGSLWNSQCSGGNLLKTPQQWGDQARAMYPGYTGRYPRMQLWHGTTDTTLAYPNFGEAARPVDQPARGEQDAVVTDRPQPNWTRTRYGATGTPAVVEGISIQGTGHGLPMAGMVAYAITFLGLDSHHNHTTTTLPRPHRDPDTAAVPGLLGRGRRQRLEHRPDRDDHHHQHVLGTGERLGAAVHAARRADRHGRLERHLLPAPAR